MKIPGVKLTSKGDGVTYLAAHSVEEPDYASGSSTAAALISPRHQSRYNAYEQQQQQKKPTSPRGVNAEVGDFGSNVQSYGTIRMKSKNLMSQLISPRSYSKFRKEEEERRRRDGTYASVQTAAPEEEDQDRAARRAQMHPMDDPADHVWMGFEEQNGPSEAVVERRKYRQAQAIDYYMRNGLQQQQEPHEQDQAINYSHQELVRHQLQPQHVSVMDARLSEVARSAPGGLQHKQPATHDQHRRGKAEREGVLSADDLEAIGDESEPGLMWIAHEKKSKKAGRARSLSTGDKYKPSSSKLPLKSKHRRGEEETPMLRYY